MVPLQKCKFLVEMRTMMIYAALGDSITAGEGASAPWHAYPDKLIAMLNQRRSDNYATGEVLAEPGWTSTALESAVIQNPTTYLTGATVITIWVGGDDLAQAAISTLSGASKETIARSIRNYGVHLVNLVQFIKTVSKAHIILCTQYNPFPNTPMAGEAIGILNEQTLQSAKATGASVAPSASWFAGRQAELIAGYKTGRIQDVLHSHPLPIHPNNRGHQVIAEGLYPLIAPFYSR